MVQTRQRERLAPPGALRGGVDADDVNLADRFVAVLERAVDLGPVEAGQPLITEGQEEALRVEPGLLLALAQVARGPGALFRVVGEGRGVDLEPRLLVLTWYEGAQPYPFRHLESG